MGVLGLAGSRSPLQNGNIAKAFLAPHRTAPNSTNGASWLGSMGAAIDPFTNRRALSLASVASDLVIEEGTDVSDSESLLDGIFNRYHEMDGDPEAQALMASVMPIACAVSQVNRNTDENPSWKQAMRGPEAAQWCQAIEAEMASLKRHHIYEEVPEDSLESWDANKRRATEVVEMLMILKKKFDELGKLIKHKARATIRGDMEAPVDMAKGLTPEQTFAPTVRHNTLKLLIAAGVVHAAKIEKAGGTASAPRMRTFDVETAFLKGQGATDRSRYVRPPAGQRTYDRRGVPIVWKLIGNCYGRAVAPRIWYSTFHTFLVTPEASGGLGMAQSDGDPCYYFKVYPDGTRLDMGIFVDDSWVLDTAGALADADLAKIAAKFKLTLVDSPRHFLNMNFEVLSPTRVRVTSENYITRMADRYVPDWRSRAPVALPSTERLTKAYEVAHAREQPVDPALVKRYSGMTGAMIYTSPCVRVDTCYTVGRLARALTFATPELEACAIDCMVYMAQHATDGITFDGNAPDADTLVGFSDSDWCVGHSTSGWICMMAGVAFAFSSKRQACIAMSSTEAEIIAASACALELVHFRSLLAEMGLPQGQTQLWVDNSGAVELSRDRKSCHRSRHVDRRYFKVRELVYAGELKVDWVATDDNVADLLTKSLSFAPFDKHRRRAMNA